MVGERHRALRQKVKYVFVIFNENRSFDHETARFRASTGFIRRQESPRLADTPGFTETYLDTRRADAELQPFRVGPEQNASFTDFYRPFA